MKKIPVAILAMSSLTLLKFKTPQLISETKFKTLSKKEADEIIKNSHSQLTSPINPLPAPNGLKNIQ